jgi:hypothetical protein
MHRGATPPMIVPIASEKKLSICGASFGAMPVSTNGTNFSIVFPGPPQPSHLTLPHSHVSHSILMVPLSGRHDDQCTPRKPCKTEQVVILFRAAVGTSLPLRSTWLTSVATRSGSGR